MRDTPYRRIPFMRWLFGRGQLKTITMLPFLLITIFGFLGAWLVSFVNINQTIQEMMELTAGGISAQIQNALDMFLSVPQNQDKNNSILLAENAALRSDPDTLFRYFKRQLESSPSLSILAFGSSNGEYIEAQLHPDGHISYGAAGKATGGALELRELDADGKPDRLTLSRPDYDPRQRPWYKAAAESGKSSWSSVYPYYSNQALAMSATTPVYDSQGILAGVVTATFTLEDFSNYLQNIYTGPNGFIIIFEENGYVLATSLDIPLIDQSSSERLYATSESIPVVRDFIPELQGADKLLSLSSGQGRYMVAKNRVQQPGLKWYTMVFLFENDFSHSIRRTSFQAAIVLSVLLIISVLTGWLVNSYITWPIIKLSEAVGKLRLHKTSAGQQQTNGANEEGNEHLPPILLERRDEIGKLAKAFNLMTDELDKAFSELQLSLREKEALLQEVNHRVKNNLQLISSMLSLQADRIKDDEAREYFRVSKDRIYSLSMLHDEFYNAHDFALMNITPFLYKLRDEIRNLTEQAEGCLDIRIAAEDCTLSIVQAVPLGLIVHELLTNAIRHAYPAGCDGIVDLGLHRSGKNDIQLTVCDHGSGFSGTAEEIEKLGLGFTLIKSLTKQLNGSFEFAFKDGFCATLRFRAMLETV